MHGFAADVSPLCRSLSRVCTFVAVCAGSWGGAAYISESAYTDPLGFVQQELLLSRLRIRDCMAWAGGALMLRALTTIVRIEDTTTSDTHAAGMPQGFVAGRGAVVSEGQRTKRACYRVSTRKSRTDLAMLCCALFPSVCCVVPPSADQRLRILQPHGTVRRRTLGSFLSAHAGGQLDVPQCSSYLARRSVGSSAQRSEPS